MCAHSRVFLCLISPRWSSSDLVLELTWTVLYIFPRIDLSDSGLRLIPLHNMFPRTLHGINGYAEDQLVRRSYFRIVNINFTAISWSSSLLGGRNYDVSLGLMRNVVHTLDV